MLIILKISLETPQRRMSDAEENPLVETEEYGEIEMEEGEDGGGGEEDPYYKELENMQEESKEDNTLAWRESQGEEEEEGEEGEEREKEKGMEEEKGEEEKEGEEEKRVEEEGEEEEEEEEVGKEEEALREEVEEEASGAQEETAVKPQEATKSRNNLDRLTPTDSQSILLGTLPVSSNCNSVIQS